MGRIGGSDVTHHIRSVLKLGVPEVEGCELNGVRKVVHTKAGRLKACYHRELVKDPDIEGDAIVAFDVGSGGKVSSVEVTSTFARAPLDACIGGVFKRFKFASGACEVTYPMTFSHRDR